jgi:hypothetical protein
MSAAMIVQWKLLKMKRMTGTLPLGVQSEDYPTCDNALEVCGARSVDWLLDQHLTRPEEEPEKEEEVAEYKATFSDALKGLEAARKYI